MKTFDYKNLPLKGHKALYLKNCQFTGNSETREDCCAQKPRLYFSEHFVTHEQDALVTIGAAESQIRDCKGLVSVLEVVLQVGQTGVDWSIRFQGLTVTATNVHSSKPSS